MVDIREAHAYFYEMLQQFELDTAGWRIDWDRARHRAGACNHNKKSLVFSARAVSKYDWKEVEQLFLHEAAHALAGPGAKHGRKWIETARELGYKGGELVRDWDADEKKAGNAGETVIFVLSFLVALWVMGWHTAFWVSMGLLVLAGALAMVSATRPVLSDEDRHQIEVSP